MAIAHHTPKQADWFEWQALPFIGAKSRCGQHKAQASEGVDEKKFIITCKGVDFAIWLVAKGTEEDLQPYVQGPELFIKLRDETWVIVVDETALWRKLRGEGKAMVSMAEVYAQERRRALRSRIRNRDKIENDESLEKEMEQYMNEGNDKTRDMIRQFYHAGGDKHRPTFNNPT